MELHRRTEAIDRWGWIRWREAKHTEFVVLSDDLAQAEEEPTRRAQVTSPQHSYGCTEKDADTRAGWEYWRQLGRLKRWPGVEGAVEKRGIV
jgi:hypothetical protein